MMYAKSGDILLRKMKNIPDWKGKPVQYKIIWMKKERSYILIVTGLFLVVLFTLPVIFSVTNLGNQIGIWIAAVILLWGLFYGKTDRLIEKMRSHKTGKVILSVFTCIFLLSAVLAFILLGLMVSGSRQKPGAEGTVIVLGCDVVGDEPGVLLKRRLDRAYEYLLEHEDAPCIVSGGVMEDGDDAEAHVMYAYLAEKGIAEDRLYAEDRATSTYENLLFASGIIREEHLPEELVIITSDFHEYRACSMAKALGCRACPVPASTQWWLQPSYFIRECIAILCWYVMHA